ncbi:MAG: bifunctional glutamate N-acetyltransferase/amino-acid acetyltransferase ArgJ [Planctomycetes bacterium]|nr:bifunctional glutamate N-acetyltransferase/amino-acid acetyltransferase ArgJ [Planctomycetota bacterium]
MKNNTITSPKGFLAAGISCGIKKSGKADIGLIFCPTGAKAAAVFTTNKITSAAVQVSIENIKSDKISAIVANSGNANCCTGKTGINNATKMCSKTANSLNDKCSTLTARNILVASTGIIGEQLPIAKVSNGISKAAEKLLASAKAGLDFAKAIMTTDTKPKQAVRQFVIGSRLTGHEARITIAGTTKGAGMLAPNMATTLCFITTDAAITKSLLGRALKGAIGNSLNKLTIDGHQSTNDTAIILSSGQAENRPITSQCPRYKKFAAALADLCDDLARQMAMDAEGATRIFKVVVEGAATKAEAAKASRAIADYSLVKCAVNGADPNWGRIICAVGSSQVKLNLQKLSCKLDSLTVFSNGSPRKFDSKKAAKIVSQREHTITVNLGAGKASDFCYGCDLSAKYVKINADYHT